MTRVAGAPNKYARGVEPGREGVPSAYVVRELREALTRVYRTDAHLVSYVAEGAARQPRINKPGLHGFDGKVVVEASFCDVDNPGHGEWTDDTFAAARAEERRLPSLATAGTYYTKQGRRIVAENFTNDTKERWARTSRSRFSAARSRCRADRDLVAQIHAIKKRVTAAGKVAFDAERTARGGHADRFWAVALACQRERAAPRGPGRRSACG